MSTWWFGDYSERWSVFKLSCGHDLWNALVVHRKSPLYSPNKHGNANDFNKFQIIRIPSRNFKCCPQEIITKLHIKSWANFEISVRLRKWIKGDLISNYLGVPVPYSPSAYYCLSTLFDEWVWHIAVERFRWTIQIYVMHRQVLLLYERIVNPYDIEEDPVSGLPTLLKVMVLASI